MPHATKLRQIAGDNNMIDVPQCSLGSPSRPMFNGAIAGEYFTIVNCYSEEMLSKIIGIAADGDQTISVIGGGHDMSGRAMVERNILIDVGRMREISFDEASGVGECSG